MSFTTHEVKKIQAHYPLNIAGKYCGEITLNRSSFDDCISKADYISLHVPKQQDGSAVIGADELAKMKKGGLFNQHFTRVVQLMKMLYWHH